MRKIITLVCTNCLARNYKVAKNTLSSKKMQLNKYCPKCQKTTIHRETR